MVEGYWSSSEELKLPLLPEDSNFGQSFTTSGLRVGMQAMTIVMLISKVDQQAMLTPVHDGSVETRARWRKYRRIKETRQTLSDRVCWPYAF